MLAAFEQKAGYYTCQASQQASIHHPVLTATHAPSAHTARQTANKQSLGDQELRLQPNFISTADG